MSTPLSKFEDTDLPAWQHIIALFEEYGHPPPDPAFRDELCAILLWARYGAQCAADQQADTVLVKAAISGTHYDT